MGIQLLEIGIKMKKSVIFTTIRGCFRSFCNHPFLVGNLCFLIYLYISFPFIFSLLVSASPVLICTAILLGTVLSFGQPNIPEIEIEEKTTYESVSIKTRVSKDAIVVEQNESHYYVERYIDEKRDGAEQLSNEPSSSEIRSGEICREGDSSNVEEKSREIEWGDGEIWKDTIDEPKDDSNEWNEERLSDGEILENHYSSILKANDENIELDDVDSFDSETVNVDSLNSPHSLWKHVENEEDEENEEDIVSDSGSESSSPDASMADIMPMLDELHPLLDEDSSNPIQISLSASGIPSERSSSRPSTSSRESADEIENRDDFEVEDDDNEDDEEDNGQGDKDEPPKSAITWTEEDQKNLMDLGSSEIERNQRLENLILRRRRKNMSMVPEINLIDLESSDFPPHVAAISTSRINPFDDSYDNIPGSAPSILLQRRNPFEIPYDSSQEKANPMGDDGSQGQLPFFKRHESFNVGVGPSVFAPNRQDVKLRPYFVPERIISKESGFLPFHRQSSELSDSKASSISETESVGSVEDLEDQKLPEEDIPQEPEVISRTEEVIEEGPPVDQEMITKKEFSEEDVHQEPQLISEMNHVSEHIGHGSQSSDEEDEESSEFKQSYSRCSSSSLMSEASERTFTEIDNEGSSNLDGIRRRNDETEEPDMSTRISVESGDMNITSALADDNSHKEPVYDSSPTSVKNNLSSSSISCDVHAESNPSLPPVLVKRTVSFVERDSENREIEDICVDEHESVREHDDVNFISHVEASEVEILVDNNKNLSRSEEEKRLMIDEGENITSPNSDDDYQEANERLMSTPSGGGSTSHFYDIAMHEPNFEHLEEVPVPNTPVDSNGKMRTIQNLNIPEIYELDHDTSPSIGSPFSPDFISMPSSASSHVDMQTIHEEADEIKEIDAGLSSDLDSVGDFSVPNEFEKHTDSIGETSTMHETEHEMNLENLRDDEIDVYEEGMKCISEPQTSEHIDTSNREINEMHSQDFTVQETYEEGTFFSEENEYKPTNSVLNHDYRDNDDSPPKNDELTSEEETFSKEDEAKLVNSALNHDYQVNISENPESDMHSIENVDCSPKKDESTSVGQVYMVTASIMHELETSRKSLDGKLEKDLMPSNDDESVEVEAEKVDLSVGEESTVKEERSIGAEKKPHHEVKKTHEDLDLTAYVKGKGNESESSSSSLSSISSESDRE